MADDKRYSVSEWFDFGGGGNIFSSDDLDEARIYIEKLYNEGSMFVSYTLFDNKTGKNISG